MAQEYAIQNVNVITMEDEEILSGVTVHVNEDRIVSISKVNGSKTATIIDGRGMFLIPGLAEMHAHIPPYSAGEEYVKEVLWLYMANGITTIRGMLGEPYHLELRKNVSEGSVFGPRIFTSGPSLNGGTVRTPEEAIQKVISQKKAGYDFLKMHPGIRLDVYDELVKVAKEQGIPFAGHVSVFVGVRHALETGYASIDHLDGYVEGLVPSEENVDPESNGFFGLNFTELADRTQMDELVALTRRHDVWVVPTQSLLERWVGRRSPDELAKDHEMRYVSNRMLGGWVTSKRQFMAADYKPQRADDFNQLRRDLIKALHSGGVKLLLGSDAPQVFNVPGFSIHNELEELVRSGLSPFEALETGTRNTAQFFGREEEFGMIKEGMIADLVLLEANPLVDIRATRNIAGVMINGQWLSKTEIEAGLRKIEVKYK